MTFQSALISQKISFKPIEDLIEYTSFEVFENQIDKYRNIDPQKAFPTSEMILLKQNIIKEIDNYDANGIPDEVTSLRERISSISPTTLSAIMFGGFYSVENFSAANFNYSLQSLVRFNNIVNAYYTLINGGCQTLLVALNTIREISDLSTDDLNIGDATNSFFASIAGTLESIAEASKKTVIDITNELLNQAEQSVNAIYDTLKSIENIQMKDIIDAVKSAELAIIESIQNEIELLVSGIGSFAADFVNITEHCAENTRRITSAKLENLDDKIEQIPKLFTTVSPARAQKIQKRLRNTVNSQKHKVSELNREYLKIQSAAISRKYSENNKNSNNFERENAIKNTIAKMNEINDENTERMVEYVSRVVEEAEPKYKDILRNGNEEFINSNVGGRNIPDKVVLIDKAREFSDKYSVYNKTFFEGPYAAQIAERINQLHYTVRNRFAHAMADLTKDEFLQKAGYSFGITSSLRTIKKQRELYNRLKPQGKPVAYPGNSWHNYGLAIDVSAFQDGSYIRTSGIYVNVVKTFFMRYNLHNPIRNDSIHFQPAEIPISAKNIRHDLVTARNTINNDKIESLFA